MPLTFPLSKGDNICYCTGKHFKSITPVLSFYYFAPVFTKELIRTENTQQYAPFAGHNIADNDDLTNQRFAFSYNIKSVNNLFQN